MLLFSRKLKRKSEKRTQELLAHFKGKSNTIPGMNQNLHSDPSVKFNTGLRKVGHLQGACSKGQKIQAKESSRQKLLRLSCTM
jgi:hypothetical protein